MLVYQRVIEWNTISFVYRQMIIQHKPTWIWLGKKGHKLENASSWTVHFGGFVGFEAKPERCDLLQVLQSNFSGKHISFLEMQSIVFHDWLNQAVLPNLAVDRSLWSDPTSCMHTYIYLLIWFFFVYLHNLYDPIWWTMYVTGSPKTIRFGWSKFSINAAAMDFRLGSHPSMYPSHPMASAYLRTELSRSSGINFQRILKLREEQNCPVPSGLSVTWKSWNDRKFLLQPTPKIDAWSKFDLRFWGLDSKPQIKL